LDIAKHMFQVHRADGAGHVLFRKRITRVKQRKPVRRGAMEACAERMPQSTLKANRASRPCE